jgi:hypothetical protein
MSAACSGWGELKFTSRNNELDNYELDALTIQPWMLSGDPRKLMNISTAFESSFLHHILCKIKFEGSGNKISPFCDGCISSRSS